MDYKRGTWLWACTPLDDEAIQLAREWIKRENYTAEAVGLFKTKTQAYVEVK